MLVAAYELAQLNIAMMREPLDAPAMADFVAGLEPINALADQSPGFVWRLQTEDGDATALRPFGEQTLINISVWRDLAALQAYVYRSAHADYLRRRREWFARLAETHMVLWWVPAGHRPGVGEAMERLELLKASGPGPQAFSFREPFPPPASS